MFPDVTYIFFKIAQAEHKESTEILFSRNKKSAEMLPECRISAIFANNK